MYRKTRLNMTELNPLLTCTLCKGYLIDATTLTECLHSFCRSCLIRYLCTSGLCPTCHTAIHKTRPLLNARVDRALQNIVYKLTPGLFKDEMKKRRDFYAAHPNTVNNTQTNMEDRGEVSEHSVTIYSAEEKITLSLEYYTPNCQQSVTWSTNKKRAKRGYYGDGQVHCGGDNDEIVDKRYLRCPAAVCVKHIKKLIRNKFDLKPNYEVEVTHVDDEEDCLPDDYTLMDVAYIYAWHRSEPLPLLFRVFRTTHKKQRTLPDTVVGRPKISEKQKTSQENSLEFLTSSEEEKEEPPPRLQKEPSPHRAFKEDGGKQKDDRLTNGVTFDPSDGNEDPVDSKDDDSAERKEIKREGRDSVEVNDKNDKRVKGKGEHAVVGYHGDELEPYDKEESETPPILARIETT